MDAWTPEQLAKMQVGGNDATNRFLKEYGGIDKGTPHVQKYNSKAAAVCA